MKRNQKTGRKNARSAFLNEDQRKNALDKSTSYTTLLPHMDEGFHMGYRPVPGLQTDGSQQPHQWLESMAKNMPTPGGDVGFAIPDVLAAEQQLRRLSGLPSELAMRHQEMIDFRALLALLLLWEELEQAPGCPALTIESMDQHSGGFAAMVLGALPAHRAAQGLRVAVLTRQDGEQNARYPLCLLSSQTILTPAADPDDLSGVLPASLRWYDRQRKRFTDPCAYLDERQLSLLLPRLRLLMTLCEDAACQSPLYDPSARLCSPLSRFVDDLLATRQPWREKLISGDSEAIFQLRTRVQAVYGLLNRAADTCRIAAVTRTAQETDPRQNLLLREYLPPEAPLPAPLPQTFYTMNGVPFARLSGVCLLEPTGAEGEGEALAAIAKECRLLDRFDPAWRAHMASALDQLHQQTNGRTGMMPCVPTLVKEWQQTYANAAMPARQAITLSYPEDGQRMAAQALLKDKLGIEDEAALRAPLSDCLLLIRDAARSPFSDLQMTTACTLPVADGGDNPLYFLPPVSPALAKALMTASPAPTLPIESITAQWSEDRQSVRIGLCICRTLADGSLTSVTLQQTYPLRPEPEQGVAFIMPATSLPMVTVWPNIRLENDPWKMYYVHAHQPGELQISALGEQDWITPESRTAPDVAAAGHLRRWQILSTSRFPAYVPLKLGPLSIGALPNDLPDRRVRRDTAAAVGLDFGSISTTVMLRQGDRIQPASLPKGIHGLLLCPDPTPAAPLESELIPPSALLHGSSREATFYSVMDLFSDDLTQWQRPLLDGHIFYPASLQTLYAKNEGTLYYDLKWSDEPWVMACLRLLLKQVMLQASLSARLHGAPSVSWRISTPNAMPPHRQEGYLNLMRGLAREVSQECGVPLTQGAPSVLYATENQAAGLYFRSRNEVSAAGGYINLDIGGGTADISLWLNGSSSAAAEASLMLGCRHILFQSIAAHTDDFERDFQNAPPDVKAAATALAQSMRKGITATRSRQKCMLLMDDFFAAYPEQIRQTLEEQRNHGGLCYTECLLLLGLGFLFHLCGVMLHRAAQDRELAPLLPARMELCIAGNGGQFLGTIGGESRSKLCQLALDALQPAHPLRVLLPVQSREPKLEVASGLLCDDGMLLSTLRSVEKWNATFPDLPVEQRPNLLRDYLLAFIRTFPQAAERLLGGLYHHKTADGSPALMPSAEMELATVYENELHQHTDDDLTVAVRCLEAVRRMWEI